MILRRLLFLIKFFLQFLIKTQPIHSNEVNFASQVESVVFSDILAPFADMDLSLTEVYAVLTKLDTSKVPDIDGFTNIMIRQIACEIAEPLTYIFNLSLVHGLCPSGWRKALVKPLHKSGSKLDFKNYWLISITSIFRQLMEKLIVSRVFSSLKSCSAWFSKR